ncbi:cytochrome c oxidase subunit 3 family protein [Fluviispira multicolorata]|uniref:Cytochrome c oxidase subunit 3 family protein n=1 Tax=Fluviispira multicolorata TaxID=2654512 RepID=A0A833JFM6_9BACT|nr:cytochrome c oxidase subunit 3 family protein [Fluviispira multicolorata]KAB8030999.1 cytochrome c oxidase subunit 3 family protein [Fluviispira multicolorata]
MSAHNHEGEHSKFLAHHFKSMSQQTAAGKLGMWIFMAQELLFFSGLFCAYGFMRFMYPDMVTQGQSSMDWRLGGINSVILLVSSLTMSLCVRSARSNNKAGTVKFLVATMICGLLFLVIKGSEWGMHFHEGYFPGKFFNPVAHAEIQDPLAHIFFGLYYVMTGMHGLHIVVGLGLMTWMLVRANRGEFSSENYVSLENTSLFWHLVDIVWIFLYPLLYLAK